MRVLVVSQVFHPDEVAVSQYVSSYAFGLATSGHTVRALSARRDYENPATRYKRRETVKGVDIERLPVTGFPKTTKAGRALNFFCFNLLLLVRLLTLRSSCVDAVLASTVPPMVGTVVGLACWLKRVPLVFWVMDVQPDEAIAAGYFNRQSMAARVLRFAARLPIAHARAVVTLDRYMAATILSQGRVGAAIHAIPLWPIIGGSAPEDTCAAFRRAHGMEGKLVVMYSGNHSVCHPLTTLLESAARLRTDDRFLFAFVGGGVRSADVTAAIHTRQLKNVKQIGYQPLTNLPVSLGAADVHVVVMGDQFTGLVHPSKIYGVFAAGKPFIYIGPERSHIADMIRDSGCGIAVRHGDTEGTLAAIEHCAALSTRERKILGTRMRTYIQSVFAPAETMKRISRVLEAAA